ncbi:hypothetical protein SLEP1_g11859 [Rubroshorea leprosula]|nr:hypothetical protein SLEP1_g11859 [Rubroshorea leprosula]
MALFSKILTQTDIDKRLAIPTKFMRQHLPEFPGGTLNLMVEDVRGHDWSFGYSIRREGHPKPVLQAGWLDFVRDNCLTPGDRITFWQDQNAANGPRYKIAAERKIKLLGREFYAAV